MKNFLLAAFIITHLTSCSQTYNFAGEYEARNGSVQNHLTLNPGGTFYFHSYNKLTLGDLPPDPSISGRGTWKVDKNFILFTTDPEKYLDYKYRLNFSNTKASFEIESPKKNTDEITVTKLDFVDSDIFWIIGIELKRSE